MLFIDETQKQKSVRVNCSKHQQRKKAAAQQCWLAGVVKRIQFCFFRSTHVRVHAYACMFSCVYVCPKCRNKMATSVASDMGAVGVCAASILYDMHIRRVQFYVKLDHFLIPLDHPAVSAAYASISHQHSLIADSVLSIQSAQCALHTSLHIGYSMFARNQRTRKM